MSALPRPDLPPGPHRDLNDALHELHHRAGWPSLRTLARAAGVSHTTVSNLFSSTRLPGWGVVELVTEAMSGDTAELHRVWLAATAPVLVAPPGRLPAASRMAGRRVEADLLVGHLETGKGLVVVAGEAGIGKTTLLRAATGRCSMPVMTAHCLPLSRQVPLAPIAALLRDAWDADGGVRLRQALVSCSPYVEAHLSALLPQLEHEAPRTSSWTEERTGGRTASALRDLLSALAPVVAAVEDLHWADPATLACIEEILTTGSPIAWVGTWRQDDDTDELNKQWLTRVRRLPSSVVTLAGLTKEETAEQLDRLLGAGEAHRRVDEIFGRTRGQPLFTEQLAGQVRAGEELPPLLADVLDARLDGLTIPTRTVVGVLGIAERPLPPAVLALATGLARDELVHCLRELGDRSLLDTGTDAVVSLRHPLLAEQARRRLVPGEAVSIHAALAAALGTRQDEDAAEVALHWQRAGSIDRELPWRVRAAREADLRVAHSQSAQQWLRVLDAWSDGCAPDGLTLTEATTRTIAALRKGGDAVHAARVADSALRRPLEGTDLARADLLREASMVIGINDEPRGRTLAEQALEIYEHLPPSHGLVRALHALVSRQRSSREYALAMQTSRRSVEISALLDDPSLHRRMLAECAWHELVAGAQREARAHLEDARSTRVPGPDPLGELWLAYVDTDIQLLVGATPDDALRAGEPALVTAEQWHLDTFEVHGVRSNLTQSLLRGGLVDRARVLLGDTSDVPDDQDRWARTSALLALETCRGDLSRARQLLDVLTALTISSTMFAAEIAEAGMPCLLWSGDPAAALELAGPALEDEGDGRLLAPLHAAAARAAADLGVAADPGTVGRLESRLTGWRRAAGTALFAGPVPADAAAHGLVWSAELSRMRGRATAQQWLAAATSWDGLGRPFDSAYCRWRAAQVALREGRGSAAGRLLGRAARDARMHAPLSDAIAATATSRARPST